jgi:hypothetical protein
MSQELKKRPGVDTLADDLVWGVINIAAELGLTERQAYYQVEHGGIPVGRLGDKIFASRAALRRHFASLAGGQPAGVA